LEILQSLNLARSDPKIVAAWLKLRYLDKGTKGTSTDPTCYEEAFNFLSTAAPAGLITEDAGVDLAALAHAKDQTANKLHRHDSFDNTTPSVNLKRFGAFSGQWSFTQLVGHFERSTVVPANDIIMLFASDCDVPSRKHRAALFTNTYSVAGAATANTERVTTATLILVKGFKRFPITNQQLVDANIDGNGMYAGPGKSWETAVFRPPGSFPVTGDQIHSAAAIEKFDDTTGPLGSLNDDGSVKCPTIINHNALEIRTVKAWTKTSQKCTRGQGDFTTPDFLDRKKPFAQAGKCYHRFRYCGQSGTVYTFDREYKTQDNFQKPLTNVQNVLGDALDDATIQCPAWISSKLIIRLVTNWHILASKSCARGTGFDATGIKRDAPFSKLGKCYHRQLFCDETGKVWAKDNEYYTYSQWAALKRA
jgi:hypothetical protein